MCILIKMHKMRDNDVLRILMKSSREDLHQSNIRKKYVRSNLICLKNQM